MPPSKSMLCIQSMLQSLCKLCQHSVSPPLYILYDNAHDYLDERHNLKPKSATPLNSFLDQHLDIVAPTCEVYIAHNQLHNFVLTLCWLYVKYKSTVYTMQPGYIFINEAVQFEFNLFTVSRYGYICTSLLKANHQQLFNMYNWYKQTSAKYNKLQLI